MKPIPRTELNCVGALRRAAEKLGVEVETIDRDAGLQLFKYGTESFFVQRHIPDLNTFVPSKIVSDKYLAKTILVQAGIPTPRGFKFTNLQKAIKLLENGTIKFPLVVKPIEGSEGEAVTVDITKREWFVTAIQEVFKYNRRKTGKPGTFLVEDYIAGNDYRFLVLDGKLLAVLMRKPAYVIGDGVHTISELIAEYNGQPGVAKDQPLCPIVKDFELKRNLLSLNLSLTTVVPPGKQVFLRKNSNVSTGGRSFECYEKAAADYKKLALKIAPLFRLRFYAVDLIAKDISEYKNFAIIEINNSPGFDIHEAPYRGKSFPVAEHLVRAMFRKSMGQK
ncbi:MAG: hypothetical protein WC505_03805 [Patescibacteria group bacterium]